VLGEHTEEVLGSLLGKSAAEIARLRSAGVV
jgi:crotonobetainyl-CoA:carnitine CoA-transferase CaiB-like acyl-CoA transferase